MRNQKWLSVLIACTLLAAAVSAQLSRSSLSSAVSAGNATVSFRGIGGSSGDTVKMDIRKTPKAGSAPLELTLPPGTMLNCRGIAQSMVVASIKDEIVSPFSYSPSSEIVLPDNRTKTYILRAFCSQFEKANPSSSTRFKLGRVDSTLACILKEAARRGLSVSATQAAVWIYTDGVSYDHVNEKFRVSSSEWASARNVVKHCRGK